jgi:hypothetical protein
MSEHPTEFPLPAVSGDRASRLAALACRVARCSRDELAVIAGIVAINPHYRYREGDLPRSPEWLRRIVSVVFAFALVCCAIAQPL